MEQKMSEEFPSYTETVEAHRKLMSWRPEDGKPSPEKEICVWTIEKNTDWYQTGCGEEWTMLSGTPSENGMRFCPICGKPLSVE